MLAADAFLDVDGARLRYRDEGHGPAVLLIHGWTLDLDIWAWQAEALRGAYRVIRYDRRGFGGSSGSPSIAGDVRDVLDLLQHLRVVRVAAVGMSQGVRVALRLASVRPDLLACLVLDGAPPHCNRAGPSADSDVPMDSFRVLARQSGMPAFRRAWAAHEFTQLMTRDAEAHRILDRVLSGYPGHDLLQPIQAESLQPIDIGAVRQRAIVLNGKCDTARQRRFGRALARELPAAHYVLIPGAGHLANLDNPAAYNDLLVAFFKEFPWSVS